MTRRFRMMAFVGLLLLGATCDAVYMDQYIVRPSHGSIHVTLEEAIRTINHVKDVIRARDIGDPSCLEMGGEFNSDGEPSITIKVTMEDGSIIVDAFHFIGGPACRASGEYRELKVELEERLYDEFGEDRIDHRGRFD